MEGTPENHVEEMKALCEKLASDPMIKSAEINDWGRFSNFEIHIVPARHTRHSTVQLKALVNKAIKNTGSHLRDVFPPVAKYEWDSIERKNKLIGYDRNYWGFDIDYQEYDPENNQFSG